MRATESSAKALLSSKEANSRACQTNRVAASSKTNNLLMQMAFGGWLLHTHTLSLSISLSLSLSLSIYLSLSFSLSVALSLSLSLSLSFPPFLSFSGEDFAGESATRELEMKTFLSAEEVYI